MANDRGVVLGFLDSFSDAMKEVVDTGVEMLGPSDPPRRTTDVTIETPEGKTYHGTVRESKRR